MYNFTPLLGIHFFWFLVSLSLSYRKEVSDSLFQMTGVLYEDPDLDLQV